MNKEIKADNRPTRRERLGLKNPKPGTLLRIGYMAGLKFYIVWDECPDNDNLIQTHFLSKESAIAYANKFGWECEYIIKNGRKSRK